jgi:uncharacterized membrane protein
MVDLVFWYVMLILLGWMAFPLAYRLFPSLDDRGYTFSRILGLLLWGYIFWLLASLGILRNDLGGLLFALVLLLLLGSWSMRGIRLDELASWLRERKRLVIITELLFLCAFAGMAAVRATNPEIIGTEKPMELAFINAILRSPTFPPHDPWLSGYAISYYYFGYVMVAMLAKLGGVTGSVAFNLGICTVFGLSAVGAYGMVYNLLATRLGQRSTFSSLLGPFFVLLVGNLEGFLDLLHNRGIFWEKLANGQWVSPFWKWLDMVELSLPPTEPLKWAIPERYWWWWRASRVVQDYDFQNNVKEVIDEFPAFSYLLADLHPHVLAMPFAFLAMAVALQLYRTAAKGLGEERLMRIQNRVLAWIGSLAFTGGIALLWISAASLSLKNSFLALVGMIAGGLILIKIYPAIRSYGAEVYFSLEAGEMVIHLPEFSDLPGTLFSALVLGGLGFLNTWDFPFYIGLAGGAYALGRWHAMRYTNKESKESNPISLGALVKDVLWSGMVLGLTGGVLYLPFYLGFSSQAGGVLPNLIYVTRGAHLWVMFAPLLVPLGLYFLYLWKKEKPPLIRGLLFGGWIILFLWLLSLLLGLGIVAIPEIGDIYLGSLAAPGKAELFSLAFIRRLVNCGGWLTLWLLFGVVLAFLGLRYERIRSQNPQSETRSVFQEDTFPLLLILLGTLLVLGPEFFFLRDQFGWRINTIFKFYYQAWLLWAVAASYGTGLLLQEWHGKKGVVYCISLVIILGMGLTYTVCGLWSKTNQFAPEQGWTLDGTRYFAYQFPDEMAGINWLRSAPDGVVAEAVSPTGGSYSSYARVSTLSGLPGVLGWTGHESQWRGGAEEMGSRQADLERLYCTRQWEEARGILSFYSIRYVFVGSLERTTYLPGQGSCAAGMDEQKFQHNLDMVFQQGEVTVYAVP